MIKADFTIIMDGVAYDAITHEQSGIDCLFPSEGKGSLCYIMDRFGGYEASALDAMLQSSAHYRIAVGRDGYAAIERGNDGFPFVLNPAGEMQKAYDGQRFFLSLDDDDVLYATCYGWKKDDGYVICFGAPIQD